MTKELMPENLSHILEFEISTLLEVWTVEEVQYALNKLVHNSDWLKRHRRRHGFKQRVLDALTGKFGKCPLP